jgi:hypothetical protein
MKSHPTADDERPVVAWTLALVPALVGAGAVVVTVVGAVLSGLTDGSNGWTATVVAAGLVAAAVVGGWTYGLYLALAIVTAGSLVADGGPTTGELVSLLLALLAIHETARFSLDARRPSRFGAGVVSRYVARTVMVGAGLVAVGLSITAVEQLASTDRSWVPIGVAATAVPLFALRAARAMDASRWFDHRWIRAAAGLALVSSVVVVVMIGAAANRELTASTEAATTAQASAQDTTSTSQPDQTQQVGSTEDRSVSFEPWMVLVTVGLLVIIVYFMLRKPEAVYQLEEVEQRGVDNSYQVGSSGLADTEAELVTIDEDALARLLGDLRLDITAEPDPARAIRFGYATVERRLDELGVARTATETEREFLSRAIPTLGRSGDAMAALTRLFEQARFDDGSVGEPMRRQALAALDDLLRATGVDHGDPDQRRGRR